MAQEEVPLLDPSLLNSIRSLTKPGEKDFLGTLMDMFFKRAPELNTQIEGSFAARDADSFERSSHALKGTCGNLGAVSMMKLCEKMEHIGKGGDLNLVGSSIQDLQLIYARVRDALERDWRS